MVARYQSVTEAGRDEVNTHHFSDLTRERERAANAMPKLKGILRKPRGDVGEPLTGPTPTEFRSDPPHDHGTNPQGLGRIRE